MSEYVLEPFLMLNALLKELLSFRDDRMPKNRAKKVQLPDNKHSINHLICKQGQVFADVFACNKTITFIQSSKT